MSSKSNNKAGKKADGVWKSDERRITEECRKVYPALYALQRAVLIATAVVWIVELISPVVFKRVIAGYENWGGTYENVMLILAIVVLVVYIIANYFWQEKMKKFRAAPKKKSR